MPGLGHALQSEPLNEVTMYFFFWLRGYVLIGWFALHACLCTYMEKDSHFQITQSSFVSSKGVLLGGEEKFDEPGFYRKNVEVYYFEGKILLGSRSGKVAMHCQLYLFFSM